MRAMVFLLGGALVACSHSAAPPPQPGELALAITSPSPGDEMLASEHPMITVTGTVSTSNPAFGVLGAWVNGTAVTIDDSGNFTADLVPTIGVNHVEVDASDGSGTITRQLDVAWAPDYLPPEASSTSFAVPDALDLDLGQRFFDGRTFGTTLDRSTSPVVAHDLAAALESILWNIDLASLIGGGLHVGTGSSSLDIAIPSATASEILVDATIVQTPDNALDLTIDLEGVYLATSGTFHVSNQTLQVAGGITADMHASAHMTLALQQDGTIGVAATNVTAVVGPLVPQFTGPDGQTLDGFITVGNNDFRVLVENLISQQLIPTFTNRIPPLLEQLLGATDKLLDNVNFSIDSKLGTPVTLTLNGKVGTLDVIAGPATGAAPGHVAVRQGVAITTSAAAPLHPASRGAIRVTGSPIIPAGGGALEIGLSQDFLNALLHSLWNSGLLEGTTMVGMLTAQVSAKLPPIAIATPDDMACDVDGVRCDLVLQLGQVELQLPDFEQSFALQAYAGARIVVDGTTLSLVISQTPKIVVWETSAMHGLLTPDAVLTIITNVVWPQIFGAIGNNLHITLPIPDLAALGLDQLSPNLANAHLSLDVHQHAAVVGGYLGLGADLALQTPN